MLVISFTPSFILSLSSLRAKGSANREKYQINSHYYFYRKINKTQYTHAINIIKTKSQIITN